MELYNRAYRLDPDIMRNIDHDRVAAEISKKDLSELDNPVGNRFRMSRIKNDPVDRELFAMILNKGGEKEENNNSSQSDGKTLRLTFKTELSLLEQLPQDVLERTLKYLGLMHLPSLETVSMASRGLFLACRQESLWRDIYCSASDITSQDSGEPSCRLQFIMSPIFRTDGLYISKITYFRQGYQESAISQPSHLVTYYRYLRFHRVGSKRLVVALVSTEKPKKVVEELREIDETTLRGIKERIFNQKEKAKESAKNRTRKFNDSHEQCKANLFIGTFWPSSPRPSPRLFTLLLFDVHSKLPMRLRMKLEMGDPNRGAPPHRSAKCLEYCGRVEAETVRERIDFDTSNWGKFYFSPVKSYK